MAARYWVGGSAAWNGTAGSKWATSSGGAGGAAEPTSSDDVFFDAASGSVTVTASGFGLSCRSLDCNGFTGTLTYSGFAFLGIGTSTVPASNVMLRFSSSMTHTPTSSTVFNFNGSNATTQTITTNGNSLPRCQFQGSSASYRFEDDVTFTDQVSLSSSTLNANGKNVTFPASSDGTMTVSSGTLTTTGGTWTFPLTTTTTFWSRTGGTVSMAGSTIALTASSLNQRTFAGGGGTYGTLKYTVGSSGHLLVTGSSTFDTIWIGANNTIKLTSGTTQTITTSLDLYGAYLISSSSGSAATLSKTSGIISTDAVGITDSTATGGATFYAGATSSDNGGNTGWIFTDPPPPSATGDGADAQPTVGVGYGSKTAAATGACAAPTSITGYGTKAVAGTGSVAEVSALRESLLSYAAAAAVTTVAGYGGKSTVVGFGAIADLLHVVASGVAEEAAPGEALSGSGRLVGIIVAKFRGTAETEPAIPGDSPGGGGSKRRSNEGSRLTSPTGSMRYKQVVIRQDPPMQQAATVAAPSTGASGITVTGTHVEDWNYARWPRYQGGEIVLDTLVDSYGDKFTFTAAPGDPAERPWTVSSAARSYVSGYFTLTWPTDPSVYPLNATVVVATYDGYLTVESFSAENPPAEGRPYKTSGAFGPNPVEIGWWFRAFVIGLPVEEVAYADLPVPTEPDQPTGDFVIPGPVDSNYHPLFDVDMTLGVKWEADYMYVTPEG